MADDKHVPINDTVTYSTSAHDTESVLQSYVVKFWKGLCWPEPKMASCYADMTIIGIAECATFYASQSAKEFIQLNIDELFDEKGTFIAHKQVYTIKPTL